MKKALLAGFVIVGVLASVGLCLVLSLLFCELMDATGLFGRSSHYAPFEFIIFVIAPLSLLVGGFLAGVLTQPHIKKKRLNFIFISPGLYLVLCWLYYWIVLPKEISPFEIMAAISSITWLLFSSLGVILGFKFRTKKRYPPISVDQWLDSNKD